MNWFVRQRNGEAVPVDSVPTTDEQAAAAIRGAIQSLLDSIEDAERIGLRVDLVIKDHTSFFCARFHPSSEELIRLDVRRPL